MRKLVILSVLIIFGMMSVLAYSPDITRIVRLCEKDTTTWECQEGIKSFEDRKPISYAWGYVRYKEQRNTFDVFLSTSSLNPEEIYQVALVGQGGTSTDTLLASACPNPNILVDCAGTPCWECGWWGDQGFYNFYIGKLGSLRSNKYVMHDLFDVILPVGEYKDVKFLVKQNSAPWNTYLFETETLNFEIIP